jgi:iron complex transport system substrate-binding protein
VDVDETGSIVIGAAIEIHRAFGPGLLESAYELILERELIDVGLLVQRHKAISIYHKDKVIENAFVLDLLVKEHLIVELKAVEKLAPVHSRQLLTYLRLTGIRVGLLMNFGGATLKEGLHRVYNG